MTITFSVKPDRPEVALYMRPKCRLCGAGSQHASLAALLVRELGQENNDRQRGPDCALRSDDTPATSGWASRKTKAQQCNFEVSARETRT